MKNLILIFLLLGFGTSARSQVMDSIAAQRIIDSLLEVNQKMIQERKFPEAFSTVEEAEKIIEMNFGNQDINQAYLLYHRGSIYYAQRKYAEAEKLLLEARQLYAEIPGEQHRKNVEVLNLLALTYRRSNQLKKAEIHFLETLDLVKKYQGEESADYASVLNSLGIVYKNMHLWDKAAENYKRSLDITEKLLGKDNAMYANGLNNIGMLYKSWGKYLMAEPYFLEALIIKEKVHGKESDEYSLTLQNTGTLYYEIGDYEKCEAFLNEALSIRKKIFGTDHTEYGITMSSLGGLYKDIGLYEKAEFAFLETSRIHKGDEGPLSLNYAASLNELGRLYANQGRFQESEEMYVKSLKIKETAVGKKHPAYSVTLANMALLYDAVGEELKAEHYYEETVRLREEALGKNHPDNGTIYHNVSGFYLENGNFEKAVYFAEKALQLFGENLGKSSYVYGRSLSQIALLQYEQGNIQQADSLFRESQLTYESTVGKNSIHYAALLYTIGKLKADENQLPEAHNLFFEAKEILEKNQLQTSAEYKECLYLILYLCMMDEKPTGCEQLLLEYTKIYSDFILNLTKHFTLANLKNINKFSNRYENIIWSYSNGRLSTSNEYKQSTYNYTLLSKGFLLQNTLQMRHAVGLSSDSVKNTFAYWQSCHTRLANQYSKPQKDRLNVAELETRADSLEKVLLQSVAGFSDTRRNVEWQDVKASLRPGEAAVEFLRYEYANPKPTDSILYAALVLRPDDIAPKLVKLFEKEDISALMQGLMGASFSRINTTYSFRPGPEHPKNLNDFIWKPLDSLFTGIHTVYCSPAGLLHRINLGAIAISETETFADRRKLILLGSTRQLVLQKENKRHYNRDVYLAGGIRYDMDSLTISTINQNRTRGLPQVTETVYFHSDSLIRGAVWPYLPETGKEVVDISGQLLKRGYNVNLDTGYAATEEVFRSIGQGGSSPRVVHVSTHGYFFPDPVRKAARAADPLKQSAFSAGEHPLIRSGLLLAGANDAWQTGSPPRGLEDGILTAYEISQINFDQTELVVLSACETGLGDIEGNEGVYGLQRAFKIAGARYLIMSLWKVNDQTTRELMKAFYQAWLSKQMSIPEAFQSAQQHMRQKYPDAPYHWAGFVLVE